MDKEEAQKLISESIMISDDEISRKHIRSKTIILLITLFAMLLISFVLNIRNVDAGRLRIFSTIGVWLIGFFFFCSGYGLITILRTKQDYLKGFLVKRVLIVLVPFFLCNYAYMSVELLRGMQFSTPELIASFFGVLLMNSQMWFAVEIMLLYIVFFLLFTY